MQCQKAKHKQQMVGLVRNKSNRCLSEDGERQGGRCCALCLHQKAGGAAQSDSTRSSTSFQMNLKIFIVVMIVAKSFKLRTYFSIPCDSLSVTIVTSYLSPPFKTYKPYIFWKLIIWRWQCPLDNIVQRPKTSKKTMNWFWIYPPFLTLLPFVCNLRSLVNPAGVWRMLISSSLNCHKSSVHWSDRNSINQFKRDWSFYLSAEAPRPQ